MAKGRFLQRFKWHIIITLALLAAVIILTIFTNIFDTTGTNKVPQTIWLLCVLLILVAVITILSRTAKILDTFRKNDAKLEQAVGSLEKINSVLRQINQNTRLSESAKSIAFRDADRQTLREAVYDKLHQKDFDATYVIIDEIAHTTIYKELAEKLRAEANLYRDATDAERVSQVIAHIEQLFDTYQWAKASAQIERLIEAEPDSQEAQQMRQRLSDKKQERKKVLLSMWDDAVQRRATDQGLEILRELDLYLTPNEGLALQEAARDVFRSKLHNLGVTFALAVSEKKWNKALEIGRQIIHAFPNSRMAEEIRENIDALKKRSEQA